MTTNRWHEAIEAPRDGTVIEFNIPRTMMDRHGYKNGKPFSEKVPATSISKERAGLTLAVVKWAPCPRHPNGGYWDCVGLWPGSYARLSGYWRHHDGKIQ